MFFRSRRMEIPLCVRMAEAVGNHLKHGLDAGEICIAQMLEHGVKARA